MKEKQLAQLNIAWLAHDIASLELADFVAALERINSIAEEHDGFIWRYITDDGGLAERTHFGEDVLFNMSVWGDRDSLFQYVYKSEHTPFMARRKEWFLAPKHPYQALWWVKAGHIPTVEEAKEKLDYLVNYGPSAKAFTFKKFYD